ncbi:MAG: EAL domain-containing protein [Gammaproteobacteria bacterium]
MVGKVVSHANRVVSALEHGHAWTAVVPPAVAIALQWLLWPWLQPHVWFMFYPAVFVSSWIGGRACGLWATAISAVAVWWLFVPPQIAGGRAGPAPWLPLLVFVATGVAFSLMHARMRRGERRLRDMFDQAGEGIFIADLDGRYTEVNAAACSLLGYARHELIGRSIGDLLPAQDVPRLERARRELLAGATQVAEWDLRRKDGTYVPVEVSARISPGGIWMAFVRDMTERRRAQARQQLAETVFRSTQDGIIVTDAQARIVAVNPAFCAISGYTAEEAIGSKPSLQRSGQHDAGFYDAMWRALDSRGFWQGEIWNRRKNGEIYPGWENVTAVRDESGAVSNFVAILSDITPIKAAEDRLRHLAHHDALTGLPNRLLFTDSLQLAMARARRHDQQIALLFLDVDRFKVVNDTLGHAAGDELLRVIAGRLRHSVRAEDMVARLGGDEFAVVVEEVTTPADVATVANKILASLSAPTTLDGREVVVSASIGVALYPADAAHADDLCKAADSAMYRAKERGRGTYDFYTADITERMHEQLTLENALRRALERDELELHYQPVFRAADLELIGVEALLRWRHPDLGEISPARFIPIAEQSGLIIDVGAWVVRRACAQAREWFDRGVAPAWIAVNVSGRQVMQDHLAETIEESMRLNRLAETGIRLDVELTESVLRPVEPVRSVLQRLRDLGVGVAIDDFGTGYSSLSMLKHLPIDVLKIDQSFVHGLPEDANSRAIVGAVVSMSHALGLQVIAEGVETQAQFDYLCATGCDALQGFLLGLPRSAGHIARHRACPVAGR